MRARLLAGGDGQCKRGIWICVRRRRCAAGERSIRSRRVRRGDGVTRSLGAYYLFQATASCVFFAPVFFVYYQERVGLTLPTILWIQSFYVALRALLEVPLGALADRHSRRACLTAYGVGHV